MEKKTYTYEEVVAIIDTLRAENGCPWDKAQTHQSIIPNLVEETYELVEALQNEDVELTREELGDVMLQVLFHAQISKEAGEFSIEDVISDLGDKLVSRHPHIFGGEIGLDTQQQVLDKWEEIKKKEKHETSLVQAMDRVAKTLPALMRTQKVQRKAIKAEALEMNMEKDIDILIKKLEALKSQGINDKNSALDEKMGEILFLVVKLSTFFDLNAEFTLTKSVEKFINRFRYIENSRFQ